MYETFYNLKGKPFNLTPDTRFLFRSPGHNRVLSFLRYGILKREGFIVVTGQPGTGKSTLIRALLDEISEKKDLLVAQLEMTQADSNELLAMVAEAFGTNHEGLSKTSILRHWSRFLISEIQRSKQPILIVDEVQNLSIEALETLRLLINYQVGNVPLLQGFLVGQDIFARTLAESETLEPMRQRIITSCHLAPLSSDETKKYIMHRLHVVGWNNDPILTPEALMAIYKNTKGVPRLVNTFCDRVLLLGYIKETHEISEKLIDEVAGEIDNQSYSLNQSNRAMQSTQGIGNAPSPPSQFKHSFSQSDIVILSNQLSEIEVRLEAVEKSMSLQGTSIKASAVPMQEEERITAQLQAEKLPVIVDLSDESDRMSSTRSDIMPLEQVKQLRAQLNKALADKERLEKEMAEQKARAKQIQEGLENDIEYLLTRIIPQTE